MGENEFQMTVKYSAISVTVQWNELNFGMTILYA